MEQFDQALLTFSQWSETVLSNLYSASQVNISNLQSASNEVNVRTAVNQDATACRDTFGIDLLSNAFDRRSSWHYRGSWV